MELKKSPIPINDVTKVFLSLRETPRFLLESAERDRFGRYSVIGWGVLRHFIGFEGSGDPLDAVMEEVESIGLEEELPYLSGFFGYLSYDYVVYLHDLPELQQNTSSPLVEFLLPKTLIVVDHEKNEALKCSFEGKEKIVQIGERKRAPRQTRALDREEFEQMVEKAKEYIYADEVVQIVLSRRIPLRPTNLEEFYLRLRELNPSPYMYFLDFGERKLIGSSPEMFLRREGREVMTRPIAGTRRRGRSPEEDAEIERDLLTDEKELAEHVMLVDLARNDLGMVCKFGSVKVPEYMKIEKYSHVQHIVSTVTGALREGISNSELIKACFPAGTVVGAPKFRAMEIIQELEQVPRGMYAGAVGYLSPTDLTLAITIRTLVVDGPESYVQAGAGVVAYSVPWKEWLETENKSAALLAAAGLK